MAELIGPAFSIFSGLCLYAGFNHLQRAKTESRRNAHAVIALAGFLGALYLLISLRLYKTDDVARWIAWNTVLYVVAAVILSLFAIFAAYYAEIRTRRALWTVLSLHALSIVVVLWFRGGAVGPGLQHMKAVHFPWNEIVFVPLESINRWVLLLDLPAYATFAYMLYACVHLRRRGETRTARVFAAAIGIALLGVLLADVNSYVQVFPLLFPEFWFMGMLLFLSANLSANLAEAHYRAFVADSTAVGRIEFDPPIPMHLPEEELVRLALEVGYLADCNERFAQIRGATIRECVGLPIKTLTVSTDPRNWENWRTLVRQDLKARGMTMHGIDLQGNDLYFINDFHSEIQDGNLVRLWVAQQDITGAKQAKESALRSEERLELTLQAAHVGVWRWELQTNRVEWSDTVAPLFGMKSADFAGTFDAANERIHPADRRRIMTVVQECMFGKRVDFMVEHRVVWTDNTIHWVEARGRARKDQTGAVVELRGTIMDISERKNAEFQIRESTERFRLVAEQTGQLIYDMDLNTGRIVQWAGGIESVTGYTPEEFTAMTMEDFIKYVHPADQADVSRHVRHSLRSRRPFQIEYRFVTKDGSYAVLEDRGVFLKDEAGEPTRMMGSITDITERRKAEESVKAIARGVSGTTGGAFFRTLVETLGVMLEADQVLVGELPADKSRLDHIAIWAKSGIRENLSRNLDGTPSKDVAVRGVASTIPVGLASQFPKAGHLSEWKTEGYTGVPLFNANGEVIGVLAAFFCAPIHNPALMESTLQIFASRAAAEIERLRGEAQIRQMNVELEERVAKRTEELSSVNRELESFSYSVSHDLRAPLRNISGFVELINAGNPTLDDEHQRYLATITKEVRRMGTLIDDLLELSRVSRTEMLVITVDPCSLVEEVREELTMATRGRTIEWRIGSLPVVRGDRSLLRQVFANLISNAVKYTQYLDAAVIEIGCSPDLSSDRETVFFIRDNGVGFDMKYVGKLFGVFQRLHSVRQFEGTGIGLANVQRIVSRHGGRVWAEAAINQGATFFFSLPS
jgi:PAS domain S-box-containing protein